MSFKTYRFMTMELKILIEYGIHIRICKMGIDE